MRKEKFMKKSVLIAGLVLSLALSGCNLFKKKDNRDLPKKQNYATEVAYAEYDEKFDAATGDELLVPEGENACMDLDGQIKVNNTESITKADGKKFMEATQNIEYNQKSEYDGVTDVAKVRTYGSSSGKQTEGSGSQEAKGSADYTRIYQAMEIEGEKKTIGVNEKDKEYVVVGKYSSTSPDDKLMEVLALPLLYYAFGIWGYESGDEAEKAKWHFYIDNDVLFTTTYETEEKKDLTKLVESETVKYAEQTEYTNMLMQIKVERKDEKAVGFDVYFELTERKTVNYLTAHADSDGNVFAPGYVHLEENNLTAAGKIKLADISLQPVDVSTYTLVEKDADEAYKIF